jgi:predicted Zn-dependent protease
MREVMILVVIMSTIVYCPSFCRAFAYDQPLTYRVGTLDERFGMSTQELSESLSQASAIWGHAVGRDLLKEDPNGAIVIDLIYDGQQAAIDNIKKIGGNIGNSKASYYSLKSQFESLRTGFVQKNASYSQDVNAYNKRLAAYNTLKDTTYRKPKVPLEAYQNLAEQKNQLDIQLEGLQARLEEQKKTADTLSNMLVVMNTIASNYNLEVVNFKNTSKDMTGEFKEGRYERKNYKRTITVYFFTDRNSLIRVLTHELGHALGLQHNNNPQAIMYYLNQSTSLDLAPEDIQALKVKYGSN